ncbi:hypothetical protein NC653_021927 [Populus alba x Populus x berolinensis]|uniref:Uncharacterized protein n=1 Tax=Populus alba x Populus x berolinensis TaxID=444605 RepID=A0AAD6QF21_9ROSI|nr:hypothetical protein NC653_021927 [Populus alba x Populus x berolinensis]
MLIIESGTCDCNSDQANLVGLSKWCSCVRVSGKCLACLFKDVGGLGSWGDGRSSACDHASNPHSCS